MSVLDLRQANEVVSATIVTTDAYVAVITVHKRPGSASLFQLIEDNVAAVLYEIRGSLVHVDAKYVTLTTDASLAKAAIAYETVTDAWVYVQVRVKSAVAGVPGQVEVYVSGD